MVKGEQSDEWKVIFEECGATELEKSLLKDDIQLFIMQHTDDDGSNALHLTCKQANSLIILSIIEVSNLLT